MYGSAALEKIIGYWRLILIIILGFAPLSWLHNGYMIAWGDFFPWYLNSENTLMRDLSLWDPNGGGISSAWPNAAIVFEPVWYILQRLSVPAESIQILFFIFYIMASGLSMYFLASSIYPLDKNCHLISSVFYAFNLYIVEWIWWPAFNWQLVFLPLLMGLYIRIIHRLKNCLGIGVYVLLFVLVSVILLAGISANPSNLVLAVLPLILIFIYYLIYEKSLRSKLIMVSLLLICLVIVSNIWWTVPMYYFWMQDTDTITVTRAADWVWTMTRLSFLNLMWLSYTQAWEYPGYYPYWSNYSDLPLVIIKFVPITLAFTGVLFRKSRYSLVNLYLSIIVLIALFLQKGMHSPLGSINLLMYEIIPGFNLFRSAGPKFGLFLLPFLALLLGFSASSLSKFHNNLKSKSNNFRVNIFTIILVLIILMISNTIINGDIIKKGSNSFPPSAYIKIPDYWYEACDWINSQDGDFRVLVTPNLPEYEILYDWGYYGAMRLEPRLINKSVLQKQPFLLKENNEFIKEIYEEIDCNNADGFQRMLDISNVRYILNCNDLVLNYGLNSQISPSHTKKFLDDQANLKMVKQFGKLEIYEYFRDAGSSTAPPKESNISYKTSNILYFAPHIHPAFPYTSAISDNGSQKTITPIYFSLNGKGLHKNEFLADLSGNAMIQNPKEISGHNISSKILPEFVVDATQREPNLNDTKLIFSKINAFEYKVHVITDKPFFLIFNEGYHSGWKTYLDNDLSCFSDINDKYDKVNVYESKAKKQGLFSGFQYLFKKTTLDDCHYIANGYANAWYLNMTGDYCLTLYFWPQNLFYLCLLVSATSILLCIIYLLMHRQLCRLYIP